MFLDLYGAYSPGKAHPAAMAMTLKEIHERWPSIGTLTADMIEYGNVMNRLADTLFQMNERHLAQQEKARELARQRRDARLSERD